ncbi:MAG TPA: fasciclin domain-containing protein [Flavitalea sp.]|nr:fasciclin domain-containing protein [Flavitalea sp.]
METKNTTRKLLLFFASLFVISLSACTKDSDDPATPVSNNVVDVVVGNPNTTLLEAAVIRAGLTDALATTQNITVFAPDDDAFKMLDINGDGTPDLDTEAKINAMDPAVLAEVLSFHVLGTKVPAANVPAGPNAPVVSLSGDSLYLTKNANGVFINGIKVKTADVQASNGVIHVIEKVLVPSGGNNIVELAAANPNFTYLVAAVTRADASGTSISGALSGDGPFTVFAPTNAAFMAAGFATIADIEAADPAALRDILLYHVIGARVFSSDLTEGAQPATLGGGTLTVTLGGGAKVKGTSNTTPSNIIGANVVATNGVIHVIDQVLLP